MEIRSLAVQIVAQEPFAVVRLTARFGGGDETARAKVDAREANTLSDGKQPDFGICDLAGYSEASRFASIRARSKPGRVRLPLKRIRFRPVPTFVRPIYEGNPAHFR